MDINKETVIKQIQDDLNFVKIIVSKTGIDDTQIKEYIKHIESGLSLLKNM